MVTRVKSGPQKGFRQLSFYLRPSTEKRWKDLTDKYPHVSESALVGAAVEFYLPYAIRGIDGNLQPFTLSGDGGLANRDLLKDTIREVLAEMQDSGPLAN